MMKLETCVFTCAKLSNQNSIAMKVCFKLTWNNLIIFAFQLDSCKKQWFPIVI